MLQVITRSRLLLVFFMITLSGVAASALAPLAGLSEKYFMVDYRMLYTYEYYDVIRAVSEALRTIFPVVVGLASDADFGRILSTAVSNYSVLNNVYFYIVILGGWAPSFYQLTIPITMLLASMFFAGALEVANIERNLQIVVLIGHRGYYKAIITMAVLVSTVYSVIISTPLLVYGCAWCPRKWHVLGALSILLLFMTLHLVEALAYVVTRWRSMASLMSGMIFSLTFLFYPSLLVDFTDAIKGLFGVEVSPTSLLWQLVIVLLLSVTLYSAMTRIEKY